jgi:hypothetical protein
MAGSIGILPGNEILTFPVSFPRPLSLDFPGTAEISL